MDTVRCQFAQVWSTESASHVCPQIQVPGRRINQADATGHTCKVTFKSIKLILKIKAAQMTHIGPDTSSQRKAVPVLCSCHEQSGIKQSVCRDEHLLAQIITLLVHTAHASRQTPAVGKLIGGVAQVIIHG